MKSWIEKVNSIKKKKVNNEKLDRLKIKRSRVNEQRERRKQGKGKGKKLNDIVSS